MAKGSKKDGKTAKARDFADAAIQDDGSGERLMIKLVEGRGLAKRDSGKDRTSDPFVEVTYGLLTQTSEVKNNTLNPHWNAMFEFKYNPEDPTLTFKIWDDDKLGKDAMGQVIVDLDSVPSKEPAPSWYKVVDKHGKQTETAKGKLYLAIWTYEERGSSQSSDYPRAVRSSRPSARSAAPSADRAEKGEKGDKADKGADKGADKHGKHSSNRHGDRDRAGDRYDDRRYDDRRYDERDRYYGDRDYDRYDDRNAPRMSEREAYEREFADEYQRMLGRVLQGAREARAASASAAVGVEAAALAPPPSVAARRSEYRGGYGGVGALDAPPYDGPVYAHHDAYERYPYGY